MTGPERVCPSAPAEPGALLLGIVGPEGRVAYVSPGMHVTQEFLDGVGERQSPTRHFRFAGRCAESGCQQWTGERCRVADALVQAAGELDLPEDVLPEDVPPADVPRCGIRARCRWFAQAGLRACAVCPLVVTDMS